jgi:hypothetical protein
MTPTVPAATLTERAMTVALHLSAWRAQRVDKRITQEVLLERKASKDAGRFEKHLVPPAALDGVSKAHSKARARHYSMTLPWGDEAVRILSAAAFFDYTAAMTQERASCESEYTKFCARYPELRTEAPERLGKELFSATDFPDAHDIREKFNFQLVIMPIADQDDFRVDIGEAAVKKIRASIEEELSSRYSAAQRDLYTRLLDTVKHFTTTMAATDKVFRDTTVTKLGDLARLAPKLSLTPDPKLDEVCAEILRLTDSVATDELRTNDLLRSATARRAQATLTKLEDAMAGAF